MTKIISYSAIRWMTLADGKSRSFEPSHFGQTDHWENKRCIWRRRKISSLKPVFPTVKSQKVGFKLR